MHSQEMSRLLTSRFTVRVEVAKSALQITWPYLIVTILREIY